MFRASRADIPGRRQEKAQSVGTSVGRFNMRWDLEVTDWSMLVAGERWDIPIGWIYTSTAASGTAVWGFFRESERAALWGGVFMLQRPSQIGKYCVTCGLCAPSQSYGEEYPAEECAYHDGNFFFCFGEQNIALGNAPHGCSCPHVVGSAIDEKNIISVRHVYERI